MVERIPVKLEAIAVRIHVDRGTRRGQSRSRSEYCVSQLDDLLEQGCETFASNQVIGEVYVAFQHHYDVFTNDVRAAMSDVLTSG